MILKGILGKNFKYFNLAIPKQEIHQAVMISYILVIVCTFFLSSYKTNEISCEYLIEHVNIVDVENGIIHYTNMYQ